MGIGEKMNITIQVTCKDRHTELALLIQSLRTQTFKNWDIVILDECQTPIETNYFLANLLNRIKIEGHHVNLIKNDLLLGVCNARNKLKKEDYFNNEFVLRVDDDVVLEQDYIRKLLDVINLGYDIASGITPLLGKPLFKRDIKKVKPIINRKELDEEGNIIYYGDDCGYGYLQEEILPAHEFRSCGLFKKKVYDSIDYEPNLSFVGFREEAFFSLRALWKGFKIGVHTGAIAWHFATPSGGCRVLDYQQKVKSDNEYFYKWTKQMYKKHGDFNGKV